MRKKIINLDEALERIAELERLVIEAAVGWQPLPGEYHIYLDDEHETMLHTLFQARMIFPGAALDDPYWDDEPELSDVLNEFVQAQLDMAWDMAQAEDSNNGTHGPALSA
ncbi:MAG: hypothetical protein IPP13_21505 [Kouleothrix sp.]|jgi:hypothetical protein|nr:hypothetical protein [Kouleothrix sp.]